MSVERRRWVRWMRRGLCLLPLAPLLLLLLANAWFALPWGRAWVAGKLSPRIGLPVEIRAVSWWPWRGVRIDGLQVAQPEALRSALEHPLLSVSRIEVDPRWSSILRGRKSLESIRIRGCEVVIAAEMLPHLAGPPVAPVQPPPVAVAEPPASPAEIAPPAPPGDPPPATPAPPPPARPVPAPADARPPFVVELENFDFRLVSAGGAGELLAARGISAVLPFQGADAGGGFSVSSLLLAGTAVADDLHFPLQWRSPELRCEPVEVEIAGLGVRAAARIARAPGLPFAVEATAGPQRLVDFPLPLVGAISAEETKAAVRATGLLGLASSWQALAAVESGPVTLAGHHTAFQRSGIVLVLQGGVLSCPDARLIGESVSFLANGAVAGGNGIGVLRVVMPPEAARAWTARVEAIAPALKPAFTALETPDRVALDLRWTSYEGRPGVELGAGGPFLPKEDALRLLPDWTAAPDDE